MTTGTDREASRRRRSIRLEGWDYRHSGAYFVTVCTSGRACLFGEVADGELVLSSLGMVAEACWREIPAHYPQVALDAFVVMPNHVHGILWIRHPGVDDPTVGANNYSPLPEGEPSLSDPTVGANNYSPLPRGEASLSDPIVGANYYSPLPEGEPSLSDPFVGANYYSPLPGGEASLSDPFVGANNCSPLPRGEASLSDPFVGANNYSPLQRSSNERRPQGTSRTLGAIVRGFKIGVTQEWRKAGRSGSVWQRNYFERILRNEDELRQVREYIVMNPARWHEDVENPEWNDPRRKS